MIAKHNNTMSEADTKYTAQDWGYADNLTIITDRGAKASIYGNGLNMIKVYVTFTPKTKINGRCLGNDALTLEDIHKAVTPIKYKSLTGLAYIDNPLTGETISSPPTNSQWYYSWTPNDYVSNLPYKEVTPGELVAHQFDTPATPVAGDRDPTNIVQCCFYLFAYKIKSADLNCGDDTCNIGVQIIPTQNEDAVKDEDKNIATISDSDGDNNNSAGLNIQVYDRIDYDFNGDDSADVKTVVSYESHPTKYNRNDYYLHFKSTNIIKPKVFKFELVPSDYSSPPHHSFNNQPWSYWCKVENFYSSNHFIWELSHPGAVNLQLHQGHAYINFHSYGTIPDALCVQYIDLDVSTQISGYRPTGSSIAYDYCEQVTFRIYDQYGNNGVFSIVRQRKIGDASGKAIPISILSGDHNSNPYYPN